MFFYLFILFQQGKNVHISAGIDTSSIVTIDVCDIKQCFFTNVAAYKFSLISSITGYIVK